MNNFDEYLNQIKAYHIMVKKGKIKEDPKTLDLIIDKIYFTMENGDNKK